jgi:hypothetical protein
MQHRKKSAAGDATPAAKVEEVLMAPQFHFHCIESQRACQEPIVRGEGGRPC